MQDTNDVRVIIAGSRSFQNYELLEEFCDRVMKMVGADKPLIISGTARGADTLGEQYAKTRNFPVKQFPAQWKLYHKSAGMIRNGQMADYAALGKGVLIAFFDGKSSGTDNMIKEAYKRGLSVFVCMYSSKPREEAARKITIIPQSLCTKDELLDRVRASKRKVSELQQANPCWKYPYRVGAQNGAYAVAVREGVLVIPYMTCAEREEFLLGKAFLCKPNDLELMAEQWYKEAASFRSVIKQLNKIYGQ